MPLDIDDLLVVSEVQSQPYIDPRIQIFIDTRKCLVIPTAWMQRPPLMTDIKPLNPRISANCLRRMESFGADAAARVLVAFYKVAQFHRGHSNENWFREWLEGQDQESFAENGDEYELSRVYPGVSNEMSRRENNVNATQAPLSSATNGTWTVSLAGVQYVPNHQRDYVSLPVEMYRQQEYWTRSTDQIGASRGAVLQAYRRCENLGSEALFLKQKLSEALSEANKLWDEKIRQKPQWTT